MRLEIIALMRILANGAISDEALADEVAEIAAQARDVGELQIAMGLLSLARNHRVKAMELRGQLAAVSRAYDGVFHQGL